MLNFNTGGFSGIDLEIGALSSVSQVQIVFLGGAAFSQSFGGGTFAQPFGGGPVFSSSTSSLGGAGSALGTLSGITDSSPSSSIFPSTSTSTSSPSITPLNPNLTTTVNASNRTVTPVFVIPPPMQPFVIHLAPSAAPALTQSNSSLLSAVDEQPTSITHFGQGVEFLPRHLIEEKLEVESRGTSLIDFVEPFQPVALPEAAPAEPAPAPAPAAPKAQPMAPLNDPAIDAALDLTDARIFTRSSDGAESKVDERLNDARTSFSLSALFGAVTVATGGFHLALREADRFRGRWVPRWVGAERPTKRKSGSASR
jgi:hypothetical protein